MSSMNLGPMPAPSAAVRTSSNVIVWVLMPDILFMVSMVDLMSSVVSIFGRLNIVSGGTSVAGSVTARIFCTSARWLVNVSGVILGCSVAFILAAIFASVLLVVTPALIAALVVSSTAAAVAACGVKGSTGGLRISTFLSFFSTSPMNSPRPPATWIPSSDGIGATGISIACSGIGADANCSRCCWSTSPSFI